MTNFSEFEEAGKASWKEEDEDSEANFEAAWEASKDALLEGVSDYDSFSEIREGALLAFEWGREAASGYIYVPPVELERVVTHCREADGSKGGSVFYVYADSGKIVGS